MILDGAVVSESDLDKVLRLEPFFQSRGQFLTTKKMKNGSTYVRIEAFEKPAAEADVQESEVGRDGDGEAEAVVQPQRPVRRHRK